jgi:hypothetical protein
MYVLLAASALVWGWVFVKIYDVVVKGDEGQVNLNRLTPVAKYVFKKDTFDLLVNYRDPFLKRASASAAYSYNGAEVSSSGSNKVSGMQRVIKKQNNPEVKAKEERIIDWSFVKYKGRITRQSTGKVLSLVNINGGDYSIEDGKEVQQVLLMKSSHDSILVKFEGIQKYIKRNQN